MVPQRLIVGVVTAPRPDGTDYLDQTLRGLIETSPSINITIFVAPTFSDDMDRCAAAIESRSRYVTLLPPLWDEPMESVCARIPDHRGLERNSQRLLAELLARSQDFGGWVVTAQDDLLFCRRAMDRVWQTALFVGTKRPQVGAVSFYTPYEQAGAYPRALWPFPPQRFYGDLLMLWRAECAAAYNANANLFEGRDIDICTWFDRQYPEDGWFGYGGVPNPRAKRGTWALVAHSPCLVQHAGVVSATGKGWTSGQRQTMNFQSHHDAIGGAKPW